MGRLRREGRDTGAGVSVREPDGLAIRMRRFVLPVRSWLLWRVEVPIRDWLMRNTVCRFRGHRRHRTPEFDIYWAICGRCGAQMPDNLGASVTRWGERGHG